MEVVVLAKTRMGSLICVGAALRPNGKMVRLIPADSDVPGWKHFPFDIGDVVQVEEIKPARMTEPPHVEDHSVRILPRGQSFRESIPELGTWIRKNCRVWDFAGPNLLFDGLLQQRNTGSRFLPRTHKLPTSSVGFWSLPYDLELEASEDDSIRYRRDNSFRVKYVGLDENPPERLPRGTLLRLSLARWHKFPNDPEEKCWLQMSGWFL